MKMWILGVTALTSLGIAACSSNSSPAPAAGSPADSGGGSSSSSSGGGTGSGGGSGSSGGGTDASSGDSSACSEGTIYTRLGGHAGIRGAVNAIVAAELADPDIVTYFFFQTTPPAPGHPTADQIEECFTDIVGAAVSSFPAPQQKPSPGLPATFGCSRPRRHAFSSHSHFSANSRQWIILELFEEAFAANLRFQNHLTFAGAQHADRARVFAGLYTAPYGQNVARRIWRGNSDDTAFACR